jgi:hypothetical protein
LLFAAPIMLSCQKKEKMSKPCIEGRITNDLLYKKIHSECYENVIWIEVVSDVSLGKNVEIFTPSPTENMNSSIKYKNVIEVPLPHSIRNNTRLDTLLGKKVFFQFRDPGNEEKNSIHEVSCNEVYDFYDVPFRVLTYFSLKQCQSPQ